MMSGQIRRYYFPQSILGKSLPSPNFTTQQEYDQDEQSHFQQIVGYHMCWNFLTVCLYLMITVQFFLYQHKALILASSCNMKHNNANMYIQYFYECTTSITQLLTSINVNLTITFYCDKWIHNYRIVAYYYIILGSYSRDFNIRISVRIRRCQFREERKGIPQHSLIF